MNGVAMPDVDGPLLETGKLQNGGYRLTYQAIDKAGNQGEQRTLNFVVDTSTTIYQAYLPQIAR